MLLQACKNEYPNKGFKQEAHHEFANADPSPGQVKNQIGDNEDPTRVIWQKPELVISQLGDLSQKVVADLGAGTGYFAFRLIPKCKKVIALDIDQNMIHFMDSISARLPADQQQKLETRLALPDNALLKKNETDLIIIVNTYMYLSDRVNYMNSLKAGLKEGGQILIVDFKKKMTPIGPQQSLRVPIGDVESELKAAGFDAIQSDDKSLDYQYFVIAEKKIKG